MMTACSPEDQSKEQIYHYSVWAATSGDKKYSMLFSFSDNYFYDRNGKRVLQFTPAGGGADAPFGDGAQATLLSEYNPMPTGVNVKWYSSMEDQYWEGRADFNHDFMNKIRTHKVNYLLDGPTRPPSLLVNNFNFTVNIVPGGLAYVWIGGEGEQYLIAEIQADKIAEEPWGWGTFTVNDLRETKEQFLARTFKDPDRQRGLEEIKNGTFPWHGEPWKRRMIRYPWRLKGSERFVVKDYLTTYVNGEQFFTYDGVSAMVEGDWAVPYKMVIYLEEQN
ncbi:MAG: DUF2931 family protein, partial [Saezia sp.]